jgi:GTP-binding protein
VLPVYGVAGIGVDWVLDKLVDAMGPSSDAVTPDDEGEDAIEWSPI